jgi:hypothetical protein
VIGQDTQGADVRRRRTQLGVLPIILTRSAADQVASQPDPVLALSAGSSRVLKPVVRGEELDGGRHRVRIAARVMAAATPGEIVVSRTCTIW